MLTEREESVLKRIVAENTPLPRAPIKTGYQPSGPSMEQLLGDLTNRASKMTVFDMEDDHYLRSKIEFSMKKKETIGQWFSRTGIGRSQALAMSKDEIKRHIAVAEANAADLDEPKIFLMPRKNKKFTRRAVHWWEAISEHRRKASNDETKPTASQRASRFERESVASESQAESRASGKGRD